MDIHPSKLRQFKPIVLYLPQQHGGARQDPLRLEKPSSLLKFEPDLFSIFQRVTKTPLKYRSRTYNPSVLDYGCTRPATSLSKLKLKELVNPPAVGAPNSGANHCMYCENARRVPRDPAPLPPLPSFKSSISTQRSKIFTYPNVKVSKKIVTGFRNNEEHQLPLSSLIVRWQVKKYVPAYDLPTLSAILSQYGHITGLRLLSPNSCLVVFERVEDACNAMQSRHLGDQVNPLHCSWWHKSMANKSIYVQASKGIEVKTDPFLSWVENSRFHVKIGTP